MESTVEADLFGRDVNDNTRTGTDGYVLSQTRWWTPHTSELRANKYANLSATFRPPDTARFGERGMWVSDVTATSAAPAPGAPAPHPAHPPPQRCRFIAQPKLRHTDVEPIEELGVLCVRM
ncbi:uncharacterized protein LOC128198372 [Bicyclus anynana]|uniref:Uncharacterized protein LOC128198372 n=1 Tax=Bicyclus anynana TaxID=110368 RepID=A0ABM3LK67_BICAN|nr:uncharacterized protein LOC128198372 [Bicyclus anynana]